MQGNLLHDAIHRGLGHAARHVGTWCRAYRPDGPFEPLAPRNQFMTLPATFLPVNGRSSAPVTYGNVEWQGIFDAAYTRPGDLIERPESRVGSGDGGIWFVSAQQLLLPVLCVQTTHTIDVQRPVAATGSGAASYGGSGARRTSVILGNWPAAIISTGGRGNDPTQLPSDVAPGSWSVLLPAAIKISLRSGDLIVDDLKRTAVVSSAELTDLGWRVVARETNT